MTNDDIQKRIEELVSKSAEKAGVTIATRTAADTKSTSKMIPSSSTSR